VIADNDHRNQSKNKSSVGSALMSSNWNIPGVAASSSFGRSSELVSSWIKPSQSFLPG
jgi:hypothetical protein